MCIMCPSILSSKLIHTTYSHIDMHFSGRVWNILFRTDSGRFAVVAAELWEGSRREGRELEARHRLFVHIAGPGVHTHLYPTTLKCA